MPTIASLKAILEPTLVKGFKDSHRKIAASYKEALVLLGPATTPTPLVPVATPTKLMVSSPSVAPSTPPTTGAASITPRTPRASIKTNPHGTAGTASPHTPIAGAASLVSTTTDPDERISDRANLEKYRDIAIETKQDLILYVLNALRTEPLGTSVDDVKDLIAMIENIDNPRTLFGTVDQLLVTLSAIQQAVLEDELLHGELFVSLPWPVVNQQTIKSYNLEALLLDLYLIALVKQPDLADKTSNPDAARKEFLKKLAQHDFNARPIDTYSDKRILYKLLAKPDMTKLHTPTPKSKQSTIWGSPVSQRTTSTRVSGGLARKNLFGTSSTASSAAAPVPITSILTNPKLTSYLSQDFLDDSQKYAVSLMITALSEETDNTKKTKIEDATVTLLEHYKTAKAEFQEPSKGYAWENTFVPHVTNYQRELSNELSSSQKIGMAACCVAGALLGGALFFAVGLAVSASMVGADGGFSAIWGAITGASLGVKAGLLAFTVLSGVAGMASAGYLTPVFLRGKSTQSAHELAKSLAPRPVTRLTPVATAS